MVRALGTGSYECFMRAALLPIFWQKNFANKPEFLSFFTLSIYLLLVADCDNQSLVAEKGVIE